MAQPKIPVASQDWKESETMRLLLRQAKAKAACSDELDLHGMSGRLAAGSKRIIQSILPSW
jgi:hypothetical protein